MNSSELKARAAQLPKPSAGAILQLVRFLGKRFQDLKGLELDINDPTASGLTVLVRIFDEVSEDDLLELGKILLMDDSLDLKPEDVDFSWLSEALATWVEKADIKEVIKNAQRVAAAFR